MTSTIDTAGSLLARRLAVALPSLGRLSSVDVHVDEVVDGVLQSQRLVDVSISLFEWALSNLSEMLSGMVVVLMIPLKGSEFLVCTSPAWGEIGEQLSSTPPSIYVMSPEAYMQSDLAERYLSPIATPIPSGAALGTYYHCWRNSSDDVEDGWARDVRVVFSGFVRGAGAPVRVDG